MSWKDQARRRHAAEKRGRRGSRRAAQMALRQVVLHPVDLPVAPDAEPQVLLIRNPAAASWVTAHFDDIPPDATIVWVGLDLSSEQEGEAAMVWYRPGPSSKPEGEA